ncbi:MAG TPA: hypothetical protein DD001_06660 [Microcoleaceae bacterium UBA10368]|jgi:FOG: WD40 repeat|nr:hypothetical protein [Microcoleaceae cyanobacterium UBA10368]HCV31275.1 hypothetical protein [Microcoleaceae cyanobacterium UBA9251]
MSKLVVLTVAEGDIGDGFPVTLRIGEEGKSPSIEVSGKLPPTPQIIENYRQWRLAYRSLSIGRIKPISGQVTNVSISESFQKLSSDINGWLASESLRSLREKLLQNVSSNEEVRLIIRSSVRELQRLPWHLWDLFAGYSHLEIAISTPELEVQPQAKTPTLKYQIRILAILGDSTGINTQKDRELLEQLPDVEITFLVEPGRKEINDHLWEKSWDILFFAGHSQTEGETGVIYLSKTESLTINELKYGLKKAIKGGLQLAIFNSCDGLGLAWQLEDLQIPQVIVMREPVPDLVAQEFLKYFLTNFASRSGSFYQAVREARERLQGLENNFPCASLLPVICQNSVAVPPLWENLGRRPTNLCPYRGLFAFREEDAPFFFGRFDFTEKLVESVANQSLVAVVGPSGIGKSSVVFAGLIPQLRREGNWQVVYLRPSNRPFSALATAILSLRESDLNLSEKRQKIQDLATYLRDKNGALRDEIEGILWDNSGSYLLLVVDQWEELYTVCQDDGERRCFLDRLLEATSLPNFKLVLTLRADFLGVALGDRVFADALQHQDLKLGPMNRQELENAIALPAEKLGVTIEDGLTKRILDGVEKQPGNLPLLEFALTELWSNMNNATLTHGAYDRIGGVEKALANHAEAVFVKYPEEQERMRRIFIQLVHPGEGTEDTRRVASRAEVGEDNWDLAVRLASERLVVSSGKEATDSETVEIVHEALIWGWERLQEWIHANRRFRTWQERLRVSLRQWQENQRDDGALLQRVPLAEAEGWLQDRGGELSLGEREFIRLSSELRDREQAEKEATEQAQQILDKAYQKARRRIGIGSVILAVSLVGAVIAGVMAGNALHRQREAQIVTKLERQGVNALRQFESEQIESLVSAMGIGQELKTLVKDGRPLAEYPTVSPMLALQKILDNVREKNQVRINKSYGTDISFSSDGKLLIFTQDENGIAKLSNLAGQQLATFKSDPSFAWSLDLSPDGKLLATGSLDGKVRLWNLKGKKLREFKVSNYSTNINVVNFSPDSKLIATASSDNFVDIWDLSGKNLARLKADSYGDKSINFSPDNKLLAIGEDNGDLKIWNLERRRLLTFKAHKWTIKSVSFSPDGRILASAGLDGSAKLWNLQGQQLTELKRDFLPIQNVTFSPNGNLLAITGSYGTINLWNIKGEHLDEFKAENRTESGENSAIFSPDGKQLAKLESDNTISLWNITGQEFAEINIKDKLLAEAEQYLLAEAKKNGQIDFKKDELDRARGQIDAVVNLFSLMTLIKLSPDSKRLATITKNGIRLWNLHGQQLAVFNEDGNPINSTNGDSMSFSPDGKLLATSNYDTVTLWNLAGKQLTKFKAHKDRIHSISFSPDSKLLATGGEDGTIKLSNLTGKQLRVFKAHQQSVTSISFSPDGQQFATAGGDNTAKLWNLNGEFVATFKDHQGSIDKVSFNPNGQILATFGKDGTVKMWDLSGKQLVGFKVPESEKFFEFSPDGKLLATIGGEGIAKLWTLSGQQVAEFKTNQGVATSISFSPDGKQVAISGSNGKVLLRPVRNLDQLLAQGCDWLKDYFVTHPEARKNLQVCQVGKESKPPR